MPTVPPGVAAPEGGARPTLNCPAHSGDPWIPLRNDDRHDKLLGFTVYRALERYGAIKPPGKQVAHQ